MLLTVFRDGKRRRINLSRADSRPSSCWQCKRQHLKRQLRDTADLDVRKYLIALSGVGVGFMAMERGNGMGMVNGDILWLLWHGFSFQQFHKKSPLVASNTAT